MSPRGLSVVALSAVLVWTGGCCQCARDEMSPTEWATDPVDRRQLVKAFPHVRVDRAARVVEFDARVTPLMHFPETPDVWLEVLVTTPDAKPHETLLVTDAMPAHIHAALLLTGAEPGEPGLVWVDEAGELQRRPPVGPRVSVRFLYDDPESGEARSADPRSWAVNADDGKSLAAHAPDGGFVFAGSRLTRVDDRDVYVADFEGTVVGLVTFGTETVAWAAPWSHEAQVDEPAWLADVSRIPPNGWPVRVRLSVTSE